MDAVAEAMTTACPHGSLHLERFAATAKDDSDNRPFQVVLPRAGATVDVPADRSMLECLRVVLPDVPASCETGLCGSCEMRVLAGRPEHRDDILEGFVALGPEPGSEAARQSPLKRMRPLRMIATSGQISSTSASRCEQIRMVRPNSRWRP